jgi:hypothetical protein
MFAFRRLPRTTLHIPRQESATPRGSGSRLPGRALPSTRPCAAPRAAATPLSKHCRKGWGKPSAYQPHDRGRTRGPASAPTPQSKSAQLRLREADQGAWHEKLLIQRRLLNLPFLNPPRLERTRSNGRDASSVRDASDKLDAPDACPSSWARF